MAKRDRKAGVAAARLDALHALGDMRALAAEARALLAGADVPEVDREAARAALLRAGPERAAAWAAAAGAVVLVLAALAGILARR
jgi:phosphoserine phosphatase